jgi:hypothetical protein
MTWVRRNRWGLLLLVPAFVLALLGNSSRLQLFWWDYKPHEPTRTGLGAPVAFAEVFDDFDGRWRRTLHASVVSVLPHTVALDEEGAAIEDPTPPGAQWVAVRLHVETAPTTVLFACQLSVLDADGREAKYGATSVGRYDLPTSPCVPADRPGPQSGGREAQRAAAQNPRPASYDVTAYVLAAEDFTPVEVRLWWQPPKYLAFDVRSEG